MPHPSRQDSQAERLIKLASADCAYVQQQIEAEPQLLTLADRLGNRLLHHAACAHNFPLLLYLCQTAGVDRSVKNNNGETAADWLRDYVLNTHYINDAYSVLDPLWQKIATGDMAFVANIFGSRISCAMRSIGGNTLLHWALYHHQWAIVKALLQGIPPKEMTRLLTIQNCYGETAVDVAQAALERGGAAAQAIINYLQAQQKAASAEHHIPSHTVQTLPPVDAQAVAAFSQRLIQGVKKQDLAQMEIYLPTLCQLAYLVCKEALSLLQELALGRAQWKQQWQVRHLLRRLFNKPLDISIVRQLKEDITGIADYFLRCYSQPKTHLVFVDNLLNDKGHLRYAENVPSEGKIYFNLVTPPKKINLIRLVETFIHEATHLIRYSHDFCYNAFDSLVDGSYRNNFAPTCFLTQNGAFEEVYQQLIIKWKFVAAVALALLEGEITTLVELKITVDAQNRTLYEPQCTDYAWLSSRNADTIAVIVMALAAINSAQGKVDIPESTLSIQPTFFSASNLQRYQETEYVPCDLPLELPPLPPLKLRTQRSTALQTSCAAALPECAKPQQELAQGSSIFSAIHRSFRKKTTFDAENTGVKLISYKKLEPTTPPPADRDIALRASDLSVYADHEKGNSEPVFFSPLPPAPPVLNAPTSASAAVRAKLVARRRQSSKSLDAVDGAQMKQLSTAIAALNIPGECSSVPASFSPKLFPDLANNPAECSQTLSKDAPCID